jgi:DNA repair protein RecO (recombination protein O)
MHWEDEGFVLAARPQGETSLVLHLLTREHGHHAGLVKGGRRAQNRSSYEIGSHLHILWRARLADHLGTLSCEPIRGYAAALIDDPDRLACLAAAASLAEAGLPEREVVPRLFAGFADLLQALVGRPDWVAHYVFWERDFLAELGFGLDFSHCAATGSTENLIFVSPKSGHAVSAAAGEPWRDKLLKLPAFLIAPSVPGEIPERQEILDGLKLTGFFLARHVFSGQGRTLPAPRSRFIDRLSKMLV